MERKEAIEVVKKNYPHCAESGTQFETALRTLIPELCESEDERIRKLIYSLIRDRSDNGKLLEHNGISVYKALAWLERQKPSEEAMEYLKENHSSSEVSDFQAAMNIAVAKAYDQGRADAIAEMQKQVEDEDAWSEEDDTFFKAIIRDIENVQYISEDAKKDRIDWLKSLKDRVQSPTKQEWSEEDENKRLSAIEDLEDYYDVQFNKAYSGWLSIESRRNILDGINENISWLKSLRPQPHWKPSDAQMEALAWALSLAKNCGEECAFDLGTLQDQLKKLREE